MDGRYNIVSMCMQSRLSIGYMDGGFEKDVQLSTPIGPGRRVLRELCPIELYFQLH